MAVDLIEGFSGKWQPERYEDTYTEALRKVVKAKLKGGEVHLAAEPEDEEAPDLMEALRLSVEQMQRGKRPRRTNGAGRLSKKELDERAKELDIPGRSKMSKDELAKAVASAR
jgi:DNA end-binding protein Ku